MAIFHLENWPLLAICAGMIASAVIDWWKFKVPNWLTFPLILSGWLLGLSHTLGLEGDRARRHRGQSGGHGAGLFPVAAGLRHRRHGRGGRQDDHGLRLLDRRVLRPATRAVPVDHVLFVLRRGHHRRGHCPGHDPGTAAGATNLQNTREIMGDLFASSSIGAVAAKANRRRPRWHRLPYGVPLCIGFVGYLWLASLQSAQPGTPTEQAQNAQVAPLAGAAAAPAPAPF